MRKLRDFATREPNIGSPAIDIFGDIIQTIFLVEYEDFGDKFAEFYTTDRMGPDFSFRAPILEFQLRQRGIELRDANQREIRLGFSELDLLDFITAERAQHILKIYGDVGVGKSCLLYHVLRHVCRVCPSLNRICPIILDFRTFKTQDPCLGVLEMLRNFWHSPNAQKDWYSGFHRKVVDILNQLTNEVAESERKAELLIHKLGRALREAKNGNGSTPVIAFDNVDGLDLAQTRKIHEVVWSIANENYIHCIVPFRPMTVGATARAGFGIHALIGFSTKLYPPAISSVLAKRRERVKNDIEHRYRRFLSNDIVVKFDIKGRLVPVTRRLVLDFIDRIIDEGHKLPQSTWLWDLADNSMRSFMILMVYALSRDDEYLRMVIDAADVHTAVKYQPSAAELFKNILLNENLLYRDDPARNLQIPNIFYLAGFEHISSIVIYWLLAYLKYSNHLVGSHEISEFLGAFNIDRGTQEQLLDYLERRRLISTVEKDLQGLRPTSFDISSRGACMIDDILLEPQYIYNVIVDCPANLFSPSSFDKVPDPYSYRTRIPCITRLLDTLVKEESGAVDIFGRTHKLSAVRRVVRNGLLSEKMVEILKAILSWKEGGMSSELARRAHSWAWRQTRDHLEPSVHGLRQRALNMLRITDEKEITTIRLRIQVRPGNGYLDAYFPLSLKLHEQIEINGEISPEVDQSTVAIAALCEISGRDVQVQRPFNILQHRDGHKLSCEIPLLVTSDDAVLHSANIKFFANQMCLGQLEFKKGSVGS